MKNIQDNKDWEKEFDKIFTRDDGLINKYNWWGTEPNDIAPQPTPKVLKQFISKIRQKDRDKYISELEGLKIIKIGHVYTTNSEEETNAKISKLIKALKEKNKD